jgi:hypothetical protein
MAESEKFGPSTCLLTIEETEKQGDSKEKSQKAPHRFFYEYQRFISVTG